MTLSLNLSHLVLSVNIYQVSKVGDFGRGWPEGSLFNSYNTEV